MSLNDTKAKYDGFQTITGGVDSGRSPAVLSQSQLAWMVNGTTRGGFVGCRPGFDNRELTFLNASFGVDTTVRTNFKTKLWQGAGTYISDSGKGYLIASVGGRIFSIDTENYDVQDITPTGDPNSPIAQRTWFCQAENFLIIQNGQDRAFIFDGASLRRSNSREFNGGDEVPTGTAMEYHNGRLWVARPNGRSFVVGDLAYSITNTRADVLSFKENTFLNGGGEFMVPMQAGTITALRSVAVQDSVTGQGPLQVFTERGCFSVNAPFDREAWQETLSPIQTISLLAAGAVAQNSTTQVNGDIWFRSPDGIRSFVIARRDHGTWVNTPLSREVDRAISYDTPELLKHGSCALFDNRMLFTSHPEYSNESGTLHGVIHRGLVVLDFAPVSNMLNRSQPVWDGMWTGLNVLQLVTVETPQRSRCFLFSLNDDYDIELWEISRNSRFDAITNRISWAVETPLYGFDSGGWNLRQLGYGDIWLNRLAGQVDVTVKFRPDGDPQWQSWSTARFCAKYKHCAPANCETPIHYLEQYRSRIRLPEAASSCDSVTGKPRDYGYRFAARLEVDGFCQIPQFRLISRDVPEEVVGGCPETTCTEVGIADACGVDDYAYSLSDISAIPNLYLLQDPGSLLWYEVRMLYSADDGYWFSLSDIPVPAGLTPEWVFQDANGLRWKWSVSMTADGLILKNFGVTTSAITEVELEASDASTKSVGVGLNAPDDPYLRII